MQRTTLAAIVIFCVSMLLASELAFADKNDHQPSDDQVNSLLETDSERATARLKAIFDFPISRAVGIDVDEMLHPEPKIYTFGGLQMIR